jgi:RNA polymerase sigma-70 factor (ECF subfamily)
MAEREEPRVAGTEAHQRDPERRFAVLYQAYYRPIMAYAVRRVAPSEDAADVVADVFTTAWRRIGELPEAPADRLWLYGVAQRVIAGRRRSARRLGHLTARLRADAVTRPLSQPGPGQPGPGQPGPGQPGLRDAISDRVVAALDRLSVREREALQLVLWEELSHAEAAQVLGCSANAVAIRVHRAKTRLRRELSAAELPATERPGTKRRGTERRGTERATKRSCTERAGPERGTEPAGTEMSGPGPASETTPTHAWMNRS